MYWLELVTFVSRANPNVFGEAELNYRVKRR